MLSIVPVVWHHSLALPRAGVLGKGPAGVALFFAISGFLITTLLLHERHATGHVALGAFYVRRALRIFPLYYLALALYTLWALVLGGPVGAHFLRTLPLYATYTANWFADFDVPHPVLFAFAWSLCTEEQFYAFWPPLLVALRSRATAAGAMSALVLGDLVLERAAPPGLPAAWLRVVTSFATPIGLGALLALALDAPRVRAAARVAFGSRVAAPLALGLVLLLLGLDGVPGWVFDVSLVLLVASVVAAPSNGLAWLLEHPLSRHVGRVSYGVYLLHLTAVALARRVVGAQREVLVFLLALPLAVLLASASHRWIEAPLLALRARHRRA